MSSAACMVKLRVQAGSPHAHCYRSDLAVVEEAQVKLRLKKEPLWVWGNEMRIRACLLRDKNGEAGQNLAPQPRLHPTVAVDEADSRPHALDPDGEPRRV